MYRILPYTYHKAELLGVQIKPSIRKNKKIDVYHNGEYVVSVGQSNAMDYPTYKKTHGEDYAEKRKKAYYQRHRKDSGVAGFYASHLLW